MSLSPISRLISPVNEDGTDTHDEDTTDYRRIVVDTYTYTMTALLQRFDGSYIAAKITALDITECRSGLGSAQGYCADVLDGKHVGLVDVYQIDGTIEAFA